MKKKRFVLSGLVFVAAALLALAACGGGGYTDTAFTANLQGTWETNDPKYPYPGYIGTLVIDNDTITITGYRGAIGKDDVDDVDENTRPFADFTTGTELPYSTEKIEDENLEYPDYKGILYITDVGERQPGIPYTFYHTGKYSPYQYFLRFTFGGRNETLRKIEATEETETETGE